MSENAAEIADTTVRRPTCDRDRMHGWSLAAGIRGGCDLQRRRVGTTAFGPHQDCRDNEQDQHERDLKKTIPAGRSIQYLFPIIVRCEKNDMAAPIEK